MLPLLLAGALSAAALPPIHAIPVLLISIPVLLRALARQPTLRSAGWAGFCFGFGHHVVGLYWITEAILIESARFWWLVPLAVPALATVLAAFAAAAAAVAWLAPAGVRRVLALAGAWVMTDLARQFIASGFPWNPWGSVWEIPGVVGDVFIQPAAWVGVHGLTLATLLLASAPVLGRLAWMAATGLVIAVAGFGLWRLQTPEPVPPGLAVVIVQGNVPQGQKWDRALVDTTFRRYLTLTADATAPLAGHRHVVIWPETASPFLLAVDPDARAAIADAATGPALVGSVRFDSARRPLNSLMAIQSAEPPAALYDKWHLVPFGEYQPDWFPLPIQVVPGGGFSRGPGPATLHIPGVPAVGPLICYEAIFPAQVVDAADRPAWLVNVTNDAWFGNSSGPRQHLAAARMRAVEEGLPLMRAANTGISAGFDAYGRELGRLGMRQTGALVLDLPGALKPTTFARAGLWIPFILAVVVLALGLASRVVGQISASKSGS